MGGWSSTHGGIQGIGLKDRWEVGLVGSILSILVGGGIGGRLSLTIGGSWKVGP